MTNLDIIKELYRTFRENDYSAFLDICDPELQWIQNEGFPGGKTHYGASNVVEGVFKFFNHDWRFEIEEYFDQVKIICMMFVDR